VLDGERLSKSPPLAERCSYRRKPGNERAGKEAEMAAKKSKRTFRKLKNLSIKAKDVRGGASDIFAKLGDIKGESLAAGHKDSIEIMSYTPNKIMSYTPKK
jgi:hypothetical protein